MNLPGVKSFLRFFLGSRFDRTLSYSSSPLSSDVSATSPNIDGRSPENK